MKGIILRLDMTILEQDSLMFIYFEAVSFLSVIP